MSGPLSATLKTVLKGQELALDEFNRKVPLVGVYTGAPALRAKPTWTTSSAT